MVSGDKMQQDATHCKQKIEIFLRVVGLPRKMPNYQSIRLKPDVLNEATKRGAPIGHSPPQFVSECVKAICEMIDNPGPQKIPLIVELVKTAMRERDAIPSSAVASRLGNASDAVLNEVAAKYAQKSEAGASSVPDRKSKKVGPKQKAPRR